MMKFRQISNSVITKMFVAIGGACIAVVLLLLGLAIAQNIPADVYFACVFTSLAVLMGLFYAVYRISKRPRFMFSLS